MKKLILIFTVFLFSGCSVKISLTNEYVKSSIMKKEYYGGLYIGKIIPDSSVITNIYNPNFSKFKIRDHHKEDRAFCYHLYGPNKNKIYFKNEYKNSEWRNCFNRYDSKKKLGNLEKKCWYKLSGVYRTDVYAYIHENGKATLFDFAPSNW